MEELNPTPEMLARIAEALTVISRYTDNDMGVWARACGMLATILEELKRLRGEVGRAIGGGGLSPIPALESIKSELDDLHATMYNLMDDVAEVRVEVSADRIARATAGRRVRSSRPALKKKAKKKKKSQV